MESRIHLEEATREGSILFALEGNLESKFVNLYIRTSIPHLYYYFSFEFTMCNPPFYSSPEEVAKSASEKDMEPYAVSIVLFDSTKSDNLHLGMYRS